MSKKKLKGRLGLSVASLVATSRLLRHTPIPLSPSDRSLAQIAFRGALWRFRPRCEEPSTQWLRSHTYTQLASQHLICWAYAYAYACVRACVRARVCV
eukprot:6200035-Pleurochrysis_carterae.AAC.2